MALKCGIIGLPNVGKSLLFNVLSNGTAASANFPFCTIEPNEGKVWVPDKRMEVLAALAQSKRIVPTSVECVDIAGLVKDAHQGEGLGNKFLGHIREVDAIVHVVRCFEDPNVEHVAGGVDPVFDKQVVEHELRCKDLDTLTKRLEKNEKNRSKNQQESDLLHQFLTELKKGRDARTLPVEPMQQGLVRDWQLLTAKPVLYFANVDEATLLGKPNRHLVHLQEQVAAEGGTVLVGCVALEAQFHGLTEEEQQLFLADYPLAESGLVQLIRHIYAMLHLVTYFTVGPEEVRAWTIPNGTKAPQAAGVIHSDLQRGFVKAEVISFQDYALLKSEAACRKAGKLRIEGKDYLVQDGDVVLFRFNV